MDAVVGIRAMAATVDGMADMDSALEAVIGRMDGTRQFCDRWFAELEAAYIRRPGSHLALRSVSLIGRLVEEQVQLHAEAAEKRQDELNLLSDEELDARLHKQLEAAAGSRGAGYDV